MAMIKKNTSSAMMFLRLGNSEVGRVPQMDERAIFTILHSTNQILYFKRVDKYQIRKPLPIQLHTSSHHLNLAHLKISTRNSHPTSRPRQHILPHLTTHIPLCLLYLLSSTKIEECVFSGPGQPETSRMKPKLLT